MPEFSWPWAAAITAMFVAFMKGLERIWTVARIVERVEMNSKTCLTGIEELKEQFSIFNLNSTEEHARFDERLGDAERRIRDIERSNRV